MSNQIILPGNVIVPPSGTFNFLPTELPDIAYTSVTQYTASAKPGRSSTVKWLFQDGKLRSFTGSLVADISLGVAERGLDVGAEAVSTWYNLFMVPQAADDSLITLRLSTALTSVGPTGYTNFRHIGWIRNNAAGDFVNMSCSKDTFLYTASTMITGMDSASLGATEFPEPGTDYDFQNELPPDAVTALLSGICAWNGAGGTNVNQVLKFGGSGGTQVFQLRAIGSTQRMYFSQNVPVPSNKIYGYACYDDDGAASRISVQAVRIFGYIDGAL